MTAESNNVNVDDTSLNLEGTNLIIDKANALDVNDDDERATRSPTNLATTLIQLPAPSSWLAYETKQRERAQDA